MRLIGYDGVEGLRLACHDCESDYRAMFSLMAHTTIETQLDIEGSTREIKHDFGRRTAIRPTRFPKTTATATRSNRLRPSSRPSGTVNLIDAPRATRE